MKIFNKLNHNPNLSLALGFFDGVHLAHQKLIRTAVNSALNNNLKSAVITFKKNPICHLFKTDDVSYLLTNEDKARCIENLGVDFLYFLDFDDFINMRAVDYFESVLMKYFSPKFITTGFNHKFGKMQSGDSVFLEDNQEKYGYIYNKIAPVSKNNHFICSTNIKDLLNLADIELANELLGKKFKVKNVVIKGNQLGRTIGFPTVNLNWQKDIFKLPYGTYKGTCLNKPCLINWGKRPTIKGTTPILEAHILDFSADLYGQEVEIFFEKKLRDEMQFNNINLLKAQILKDCEQIK